VSRETFGVSCFAVRAVKSRRGLGAALAVGAAVLAAAGCGSSSGSLTPTIQPARVYRLGDFRPTGTVQAGRPTELSFTVVQPSGRALTAYRKGSGPHTGVHLLVVRSDLATLIHRHPPIGANGHIVQPLTFPLPGRYRVVVDAYPATGQLPNFQLFRWITVAGKAKPEPLPPFHSEVTADGYRFVLHGKPNLHAIRPAFLTVTVAGPDGRPAAFTPWYGALAHAIFFRSGSLDYFHTHVCSPGATGCTSVLGGSRITGRSSTPGRLTVGVLLPLPGTWRLFLQVRTDGRVLTAPFTLHVG
jgi:hypothetical protein